MVEVDGKESRMVPSSNYRPKNVKKLRGACPTYGTKIF